MRVARPVILDLDQKQLLQQQARARSLPARQVERARIVLRAAEGLENQEIADELGITPEKVSRWRNRYLEGGIAALRQDAPRSGRPRSLPADKEKQIVEKTTQDKPNAATHWSTRTMAVATGVSEATVRRIWHKHGLKPHLVRMFKVSNDPQFAEKLEAVVGLYLNPPEHALVLCVDEKSQIQALDRTQPGLPIKKGRCGTVISMCDDRHRHQEWLKFLRVIDDLTPAAKQIHLIADNYATHKHPKVQRWLERHPRFHMHFTPTSSSWLNMVERFFRDLTTKRIRRGVFRDVEELIMAIGDYIDHHNRKPKPFIWTAKANDILEKVKRARKVLDNR
jgi:transposase